LREWSKVIENTFDSISIRSSGTIRDAVFYLLKIGTDAHINFTETPTFAVGDKQKLGKIRIE
jgi:hypothetical protein